MPRRGISIIVPSIMLSVILMLIVHENTEDYVEYHVLYIQAFQQFKAE